MRLPGARFSQVTSPLNNDVPLKSQSKLRLRVLTVRNRPVRKRRPTADYGTFSGALLFCFLNQNWCRDPQKAKKWFDYQKKTKVALDYI